MVDYEFRIQTGDIQYILPNASKRRFVEALNGSGDASFELDLSDSRATDGIISPGVSSLFIYRDKVLKFGGQIFTREKNLALIERKVRYTAIGWYELLKFKYSGVTSPRVFSNVDAGTIAWTLIDEAQALTYGDLLINQGNIVASVNRTRTYERATVKDSIDALANVYYGIDFEITPLKVFNVYYPMKGSVTGIEFKYPGCIENLTEVTDATAIANNVTAIGKGWGEEEITANRENVDSEAIYKRREMLVPYKDIDNATVLGDIAEEAVAQNKDPKRIYTLRLNGELAPDFESYNIGDVIKLKVKDDYWQLDQSLRIFRRDISISEEGVEAITLTVAII